MKTNKLSVSNSLKFILGGKAIFTILSTQSGKRFTYKVTKSDNGKFFFVKVLCGQDNTSDYQYIGYITSKNNDFVYGTGKSRIGEDALSVVSFKFSFEVAKGNKFCSGLEIYHEGKCCRCGRRLTDPTSITNGIGPECMKM